MVSFYMLHPDKTTIEESEDWGGNREACRGGGKDKFVEMNMFCLMVSLSFGK